MRYGVGSDRTCGAICRTSRVPTELNRPVDTPASALAKGRQTLDRILLQAPREENTKRRRLALNRKIASEPPGLKERCSRLSILPTANQAARTACRVSCDYTKLKRGMPYLGRRNEVHNTCVLSRYDYQRTQTANGRSQNSKKSDLPCFQQLEPIYAK